MREQKKKPAPVRQHQGRQREMISQVSNTIPALEYSPLERDVQEPVCGFLLQGRENALTAREIARMMGCNHREVTRAVQRARLRGAAICSSTGNKPGYFLTEDPAELRVFRCSLEGRLRQITATVGALMATEARMRRRMRAEK